MVAYDSAIIYELEGNIWLPWLIEGAARPRSWAGRSIQLVESALAQEIVADQEPILISDLRGRTDDSLLATVSDWACCGMAAPLGIRQRCSGADGPLFVPAAILFLAAGQVATGPCQPGGGGH